MSRVLVTGLRAPTALELVRQLHTSGYEIYAADSVKYPYGSVSNAVKKYFVMPQPALDTQGYIDKLIDIIKQHDIKHLIPSFEEVFYISFHKDKLSKHTHVFCDEFSKLRSYYNTATLFKNFESDLIRVPNYHLLTSREKLNDFKIFSECFVFKPVYSHPDSCTLHAPDYQKLKTLKIDENNPWIARQMLDGREYCSYSVCFNGNVQLHSCYRTLYSSGVANGFYYQPFDDDRIFKFVEEFVDRHTFTGQIGFNFLVSPYNEIHILEANPRTTAGIHLLKNPPWDKVLENQISIVHDQMTGAKMLANHVLGFGLRNCFSVDLKELSRFFFKAKDVVWRPQDKTPKWYQPISAAEQLGNRCKRRFSFNKSAKFDIEWNGDPL